MRANSLTAWSKVTPRKEGLDYGLKHYADGHKRQAVS